MNLTMKQTKHTYHKKKPQMIIIKSIMSIKQVACNYLNAHSSFKSILSNLEKQCMNLMSRFCKSNACIIDFRFWQTIPFSIGTERVPLKHLWVLVPMLLLSGLGVPLNPLSTLWSAMVVPHSAPTSPIQIHRKGAILMFRSQHLTISLMQLHILQLVYTMVLTAWALIVLQR